MTNKIKVELGEKSYEILVEKGAIKELAGFLRSKDYSKIFIISDENVARLHLARLEEEVNRANEDGWWIASSPQAPRNDGDCYQDLLRQAQHDATKKRNDTVDNRENRSSANQSNSSKLHKIIIAAGEESKNFRNFEKICEEILQKNADRKSLIIAFGGGVVGDLAGFVASAVLRGIDFVQIPTTLLSMVDSSVGGKTAVNCAAGKNMIGSFYQPKLVLCDLDFLASLPKREMLAGYAEVAKYGLIFDSVFFDFLENYHKEILALDEEMLKKAVVSSCQIKAEVVAQDEREQNLRAILNFGHTFAHSLEKELNYDGRLNHGEAVGIGMLMASEMSKNLGLLDEEAFKRIANHITESGLKIDLRKIFSHWNKENLVRNLYHDKKTQNGKLTFILLDAVGHALVEKGVAEEEFLKVIVGYV